MPEQSVVEAPVIQTPVTTVVETSNVNPATTPEPDILTKVTQFKLPETPIVNAPEQPEFASITDPLAKKAAADAVERMRRGMQADYTKKLEDAKNLVNQTKTWTPQRIQQELLNNPEFLAAAQMVNSNNTSDRSITPEEYSALTDKEKQAFNEIPQLRNELQQIKQNTVNEQIKAQISQKDLTLRQKYSDYDTKAIDEACVRLGQMNLADVREFVYKAINYEPNVLKGYEMGKLEGQGKLQTKLNTIVPIGSTAVNNQTVPTKNKGESDKAFFVRLGEFRNAQFKAQK